MKQVVDGITISDSQQADAIERAIVFYREKKPRNHSEASVKFHMAALKAAVMTIRAPKDAP
jgi:hypothetical protein